MGSTFADRYRLLAVVSSGANTVVFDAWDMQAHRHVTVKLIRPELSERPGFIDSFDVAMQSASAVTHPQLVALFDWGVHVLDDRSDALQRRSAYTVTERLDGGSLRDLFDRGRTLAHSQALQIGLDLCHALAEVHRSGLVHGELTPAKVLFGADGHARLADLGAAGVLNAMGWNEPSGLDNHVAAYASPEQAGGSLPGAASDVYALSLVLVEGLTGSTPFRTDSTNTTLAARVDRLLPVTAELGPLATVLEHAARPEPTDRASAVEFGLELVGAARRLPRPEPLELTMTPPPPVPVDAGSSEMTVIVAEPSGDASPTGTDQSARALADSPDLATASEAAPAPEPAPTPAPAPARSRRPKWTLPVAAAAGVLLLVLIARWLLVTPTHEVPVLAGRAEAEAINLVTPFDWVVTVERERSDSVPEAGLVIRTLPVAGTVLQEGADFTVVVSDGPLLRELPETTGVDVDSAVALLEGAGFAPYVEQMPNEVIPAGEVISWSVPDDPTLVAGDDVEPGTTVIVVASSGPAPREVPELVGKIVGVARAELVAVGLRIVEGEGIYDESIPVGQILEQEPAAGVMLERGASVTVTVSLGPDVVTFPSLPANMAFVDAQRLLIDAGFTVQLSLGAADGAVESVTIDGEQPEVGATFPRGTRVDVVAV